MDEHKLIEKLGLEGQLEFKPDEGAIWIGDSRMLLVHARSMAKLRADLVQQLGVVRARRIFWRLGFQSGKQDAQLALKHLGNAEDYDVFCIGPALHTLEGIAHADLVKADIDWESGSFEGEVHWKNSWEANAFIESGAEIDSEYPGACWMATGYASGYTTTFFKRVVIFQEMECSCQGHAFCTIIGKPAEAWPDQDLVSTLWGPGDVDSALEIADELRRLRRHAAEEGHSGKVGLPGNIVGKSSTFLQAFSILEKAAKGRINVMLLGETGVGKEVFARWLHENSATNKGPFVAVNCSAIPAELVEAELFGVRRGAYTGADETRPGRFERADKGTLFLDEVGDLPLAAQAKLLRVLQTGEVERLGDDKVIKVDVRLISATNVELGEAMRAGRFRSDLYYRLATYPIMLPPLRERRGDVALIAQAMLERFSPLYGKKIPRITERALHVMEAYSWPGNVRELENYVERAVLLADDGEPVGTEHLPPVLQEMALNVPCSKMPGDLTETAARREALARELFGLGVDLEQQEKMLVEIAFRASGGCVAEAARSLHLTRRQFAYKLQKFGIAEAS